MALRGVGDENELIAGHELHVGVRQDRDVAAHQRREDVGLES